MVRQKGQETLVALGSALHINPTSSEPYLLHFAMHVYGIIGAAA